MRGCVAAAALLLAACDAGQGAEIQPLPPLKRPSPEVRAGLLEVAGTWRFAGFEISPRDTARLREAPELLAPPGDFVITTQRLDSLAGVYTGEGGRYPFVGELRRDGVIALVATDADAVPRFASGRVVRDTFWLELTSFPSLQGWPAGTRAALVRTAVARPFRRFLGGAPIVNLDSLRLDSLRRDSVRRADSARAAVAPQQPAPPPTPTAPPPSEAVPRPRAQQPSPAPPQRADTPAPREPAPRPAPAPELPPAPVVRPVPSAPPDTLRIPA